MRLEYQKAFPRDLQTEYDNMRLFIRFGTGHSISYKIVCAASEDSDQPVHPRSLISEDSDQPAVQSDLSLRCPL